MDMVIYDDSDEIVVLFNDERKKIKSRWVGEDAFCSG